MSKKKRVVKFETDKKTAKEAKAVFAAMGLDMQTGLNLYLTQVIASQGLPFIPTASAPEEEKITEEIVPAKQTAACEAKAEAAQ